MTQLANQITHTCQDLAEIVQSMNAANSKRFRFWVSARQRKPLAKPDIEPAKALVQSITDQLSQMRLDGTAYQYPISEVRQLYRFLHHLRRFVLALEQLTIALVNRERIGTQPQANLRLSWHPVAFSQFLHILKTGFAVWLALVLLNDWLKLPFNYYAIVAVVVAMQPTVGKSVTAGVQRVIATGIGAVYALLLIHTLGGTPLTLVVGIVLIILTCSYLGFSQGYIAGCILIILTLLSHDNDPNGYIWGRFFETLIGTVIALILSQVLWPNRSSQQLDQGISQTFSQLGSLYSQLVDTYLQGTELSLFC